MVLLSSAVLFSFWQLARVVDQDRAKAQAVIQLNLSKEVMDVDFDDICEYLGETDISDYLG